MDGEKTWNGGKTTVDARRAQAPPAQALKSKGAAARARGTGDESRQCRQGLGMQSRHYLARDRCRWVGVRRSAWGKGAGARREKRQWTLNGNGWQRVVRGRNKRTPCRAATAPGQ